MTLKISRKLQKLHLKVLDLNSYLYTMYLKYTWKYIGAVDEKLQHPRSIY